jgi:hypothetical protein
MALEIATSETAASIVFVFDVPQDPGSGAFALA